MRDLLYICGGIAGGWLLGRALFGPVRPRRNNSPEWVLVPLEETEGFYDVQVDGLPIGMIGTLDIARGESEVRYDAFWDDEVVSSGHETPEGAAESLYAHYLEVGAPEWEDESEEEEPLEAYETTLERGYEPVEKSSPELPSWVRGITVWTTTKPGRRVVLRGSEVVGYVEGYSTSWKGYARKGTAWFQVAGTPRQGVLKQNAIASVFLWDELPRFLSRQRQYVEYTTRDPRYAEQHEKVSAYRPEIWSAADISEKTGIPQQLIEKMGTLLAENKRIWGLSAKVRVAAALKETKVVGPTTERELRKARSRRRRGRKPRRPATRKVVALTDVAKLRAGGVLSKTSKQALPRARTLRRYSFALYGPDGSVGMFEADTKAFESVLDEPVAPEWRSFETARRERRAKLLEERAAAEAEAKEQERQQLAHLADEHRERAVKETEADILRRILTAASGETLTGEYFEDVRLEQLGVVESFRDKRRRIKQLAGAHEHIQQLEAEIAKTRNIIEVAKAKDQVQRLMGAAVELTRLQSELLEAQQRRELLHEQLLEQLAQEEK